ncbi:MAG: hypothetical protein D6773_10415 [Alphaproteobacteria bacterium]|nr:MAG: hypothetical protein D6773_10415 [Alphaproteobacteria bacterium]
MHLQRPRLPQAGRRPLAASPPRNRKHATGRSRKPGSARRRSASGPRKRRSALPRKRSAPPKRLPVRR